MRWMRFTYAMEKALSDYAKRLGLTRAQALERIVSGWLLGAGYLNERDPLSERRKGMEPKVKNGL